MDSKDKNLTREEEVQDYLFNLLKLKNDEVFFLAKCLEVDTNNDMLYNARNIITKLESLPKDEFIYAKKFIDNLLKSCSKKEREKELKNRIPISDKIFFFICPKVDLNTKAFSYFPIKVTNIIYSIFNICLLIIFSIYRFIQGNPIDTIIPNNIKEYIPLLSIIYITLQITAIIFLFISAKNDNYLSAKISLLLFEFKYIILVIQLLIMENITKLPRLPHILLLFIGYQRSINKESTLLELLTCILFPLIFEFFSLYLSYLQLSITRIKGKIKNL